jgi:hypothetical protein
MEENTDQAETIFLDMERFHHREVMLEIRGVKYPKTGTYPKLVFQVWHPFWTMKIPTALCLN